MNVYVESNFVLELALEQKQVDSCIGLIELASQQKIRLAIPAFSLAEPHQAIASKKKARLRLAEELDCHLNELSRSRSYHETQATFSALTATLIRSAESERNGLRRAVLQLLRTAEVIPLNDSILGAASGLEDEFDLSGQDAIVLASVLGHLGENQPAAGCFLSRNSKDFDDPDIRERLDSLSCNFFSSFDHALGHIASTLKTQL